MDALTAPVQVALVVAVFSWLFILTFLVIRQLLHYSKLAVKTKKDTLQDVLEELLKLQKDQEKTIASLAKQLTHVCEEGDCHIQKIGFIRFNPFENTGGDQSFTLALLDNHDNGMVFSFLHSRDTTRVYAKQVSEGKSRELPLSSEEEKAIVSARKKNP